MSADWPGGVHPALRKLAAAGVLEEMSWGDECPSFGGKFQDDRRNKLWARLWVENEDPALRRTWKTRYTVTIQPDPTVVFGRRVLATDDFNAAFEALMEILRNHGSRDKQGRFRVAR